MSRRLAASSSSPVYVYIRDREKLYAEENLRLYPGEKLIRENYDYARSRVFFQFSKKGLDMYNVATLASHLGFWEIIIIYMQVIRRLIGKSPRVIMVIEELCIYTA